MDSTFFHRYDEEFLAFIAAGELRIPVHTETGRALGLHQRAWCVAGDHCVQWRPASGRGAVLSFTVTRRPYTPEFPVPLVHGLIELAEGPRLICRLDGVTPEAVAVLFELASEVNRSRSAERAGLLKALGAILGLLQEEPTAFLQGGSVAGGLDEAAIQAQIEARAVAKAAKDWPQADRIRQALLEQGVVLKDGPAGTSWERA